MGIMDIMGKDTSTNNANVALGAVKGIDTDIDAITSIGMKLDAYLEKKEQSKIQSAVNLSQMFANEQMQQFKMQQDVAKTQAQYGLADAQLTSLDKYRGQQVALQNRRANLSEKQFNEKVREFDTERQDVKDRQTQLDEERKAKDVKRLADLAKKQADAENYRKATVAYNELLAKYNKEYELAKTPEEKQKAIDDFNKAKIEMQSWGVKPVKTASVSSLAGKEAKSKGKGSGEDGSHKATTAQEYVKLIKQGVEPTSIRANEKVVTTAVNILKADGTPNGSTLANKVITASEMSKPDVVDTKTAINPNTSLGAKNYTSFDWAISTLPFTSKLASNKEVNQEIINQAKTLPTPQQETAILIANLMGKEDLFQNGLVGNEVHAQQLINPFNDLVKFAKGYGAKDAKELYTTEDGSFTERHTPDWLLKWNYNNTKGKHTKDGNKEAEHLKHLLDARKNKGESTDIMKYIKNINETLTKNKPSEGKAVLLQSQLAFEQLSQTKDAYTFDLPVIYYDKKAHKIKHLKDNNGNPITKPVNRSEMVKLAMPYVLGKVIFPVKKVYGE